MIKKKLAIKSQSKTSANEITLLGTAKRTPKAKKRLSEASMAVLVTEFLDDAAKRGELNPSHRRDFDQLLDDVVPPATPKK